MDATTTIFIVIVTIATEKFLERLASDVRKLNQNWKTQIALVTKED